MPKFTTDDEELEVPAKPTAKAGAATATARAAAVTDDDEEEAPKASGKAEEVDDAAEVEFGDEKYMQRSDGLDRLRPAEKGKVVRFAILPYVKQKMAYSHYIEKKGRFRCLSTPDSQGICCKKLDDPEMKVVALALHYANAESKTGKYAKKADGAVPPIEWEVRFVTLSQANFRQISKLLEEDQSVYDIDLVMSHADRAFGWDFNKISSKARYKQNPELVKEVEAACEKFLDGKKLIGKLGKKVTVAEMKTVLASLNTGNAEAANVSDMDDL